MDFDWGKILGFLFGGGVIYKAYGPAKKFLKKRFFKSKKDKINIALAFDIPKDDKKTLGYFSELKNEIKNNLNKCGLEGEFVLKDLSDCCLFENKSKAEEYVKEKKIDVLVWGRFSTSMKKNGEEFHNIEHNFTFSHRSDEKGMISQMVRLDIGSKIKKSHNKEEEIENYIKIREKDSYDDICLVSEKISFLSIYIATLIMKISGVKNSLEKCTKVYEKIMRSNSKFNKNAILPHLTNCYELQIVKLGMLNSMRDLFDVSTKLINLNPRNYNALVGISFSAYKIGKISESKNAVKECYHIYSQDAIAIVNAAFVDILENNYKGAFKKYSKIQENRDLDLNCVQVNKFFEEEFQKKNFDPAFLYANAVISKLSGNEMIAREDFGKFIDEVEKMDEIRKNHYKEMYRDAKKKIKEINEIVLENDEKDCVNF